MANYYTAGLKGRWLEDRRRDDHKLTDDSMLVDALTVDPGLARGSGRPRSPR